MDNYKYQDNFDLIGKYDEWIEPKFNWWIDRLILAIPFKKILT